MVVNKSMIDRDVERKDIRVVYIEGNEIAEQLGDKRMTNMVLLGGLLANHPFLKLEDIEKALEEHLPVKHHKLLPQNYKALRKGAEHKV